MLAAYIDESKAKQYVFAVVLVPHSERTAIRKALMQFVLPGQRSLHFVKESVRRRKQILTQLTKLPIKVLILKSDSRKNNSTRENLIRNLVRRSGEMGVQLFVFDMDQSTQRKDQITLTSESSQRVKLVTWDFLHRNQEPLLWAADAVAWCVNRGGDWARMARPLILETIEC